MDETTLQKPLIGIQQPLNGIQRALMALTSMTHQYHVHPEVRAWAEKVWAEGNQETATFKHGKITLALTKEAKMHNCLLALRKAMPSCSSDAHKETLMAPWVALQQSEVDIESWVVLFVCGMLHLPYKASVQIVCDGKGGDLHVRVQMGWYLYEIRPQIPEVQVEDAFSAPINF